MNSTWTPPNYDCECDYAPCLHGTWTRSVCNCICHRSIPGIEVNHAVACCGYITHSLAAVDDTAVSTHVRVLKGDLIYEVKPPDYK